MFWEKIKMKIAKIRIKNFRHIDDLELNFTDSLGRVREITALVGPNTSGKTTILDAIAASVWFPTEIPALRPDFKVKPGTVVRRGALESEVSSDIRFSDDEVEATTKLYELAEKKRNLNYRKNVTVTWTYPSTKHRSGNFNCNPKPQWLFKGRVTAARLLSTGRIKPDWFNKTGRIVTFDQQRMGLGKTIEPDIWKMGQRGFVG
jgi:hypothetical protein